MTVRAFFRLAVRDELWHNRSMKYLPALLCSCAAAWGALLHGEVRVWTLAEGKKAEGEYISVEKDKVRVLIKGREQSIKLASLSPEDREYVRVRRERELSPGSVHENNNFNARWPSSSAMEDKQKARAVQEKDGDFIYETSHFRFYSPARLSLGTVVEIGRIFEGTYSANLLIPLNPPCRRYEEDAEAKLPARLFLTKEAYAQATGGVHAGSAGLFNGTEVLVPFESLGIVKKGKVYTREPGARVDSHTLVHEITHQMTMFGAKTLSGKPYTLPIWYAEGIAEYVGVTPYRNGNLKFTGTRKALASYVIGGPGVSGRQLGAQFSSPPLRRFMEQSIQEYQSARGEAIQFNYGMSLVLFYYFAHIDGRGDAARLKRWMRALQNDECEPTDYGRLLDGRSWEQLEKEVARGVKSKLGIAIDFEDA